MTQFQKESFEQILQIYNLITKITDYKEHETLKKLYKEFQDIIELSVEYLIEWQGYIRYQDSQIYNYLYLLITQYQSFIRPITLKLNVLNPKLLGKSTSSSSINTINRNQIKSSNQQIHILNSNIEERKQLFITYKKDISDSMQQCLLWIIQAFTIPYMFFISIISNKSFELSKEIYLCGIGLYGKPLNKLDEIATEYNKQIYHSIRNQSTEKFTKWYEEIKNEIQEYLQTEIKSDKQTIDLLMKITLFRNEFLSNEKTFWSTIDSYPIDHCYRKELLFIDSIRKIKSQHPTITSLQIMYIDKIKEITLENKKYETEENFGTILLKIFEEMKDEALLYRYFKLQHFSIEQDKWKEDIEKVFERHKELFKKLLIAEQNKQQNNIASRTMEYELSLQSLSKSNHPYSSIMTSYFNLKYSLEGINDSILGGNIKTLSVLIYKSIFYFRNMQRLIELYFEKSKQLIQLDSLMKELPNYLKSFKSSATISGRIEFLTKITTIISLNDIIYSSLSFKENEAVEVFEIFGYIQRLNDIRLIFHDILLNNKQKSITLFNLTKIYRDLFNLFIKRLETVNTKKKSIRGIVGDRVIKSLLKCSLKYDDGDTSTAQEIISHIESCKSIISILFSELFPSNNIYLLSVHLFGFITIASSIQWYFEYDIGSNWKLLEKVQTSLVYTLYSQVIDDPLSETSTQACCLLGKLHKLKKQIHNAEISKNSFNSIFTELSTLTTELFKSYSLINISENNYNIPTSLFRISSLLKVGILLKQFIENKNDPEYFNHAHRIIGVIKAFLHFIQTNVTFGVIENDYPNFIPIFNKFMKDVERNNHEQMIITAKHLLIVIFDRIDYNEFFFEIIKSQTENETQETHKDLQHKIEDIKYYFELYKFIHPRVTKSKFSSVDYFIEYMNVLSTSDIMNRRSIILSLLVNYTDFSTLITSLIAVLKKYEELLPSNPLKGKELKHWIHIALKTYRLYASQQDNYDSLMQMTDIILKKLYYNPTDSLTVMNPLTKVINIMESYIKKDTEYISQLILRLLKQFVICFEIPNEKGNDTFQIIQFQHHIESKIKQTSFYLSILSHENSQIVTLKQSLENFTKNINELTNETNYQIWKSKLWNYFIQLLSDIFPIDYFLTHLKENITTWSFNLLFGIHFKKDIGCYYDLMNCILFKSEKFEEMMIIGRKVYKAAYELAQIGNREFVKINKIDKYDTTIHLIFDEINKIISHIDLKEVDQNIFEYQQKINENNDEIGISELNALYINENEELEITQYSHISKNNENDNNSEEENEDSESSNETLDSTTEDKMIPVQQIKNSDKIEKSLHNILMYLQTIELDKKSRPKVKIIRLLTSVAEHFFTTADSLNDEILPEKVITKSERLLTDSLCVRELLRNLLELVVTIRSVISNDKEKIIDILEYIQLYDTYNENISETIHHMFLFVKVFRTFNKKRCNESKQLLNRMVSGLIYFFITPFIDIEIHDSTYVNSFIYNQSKKDHIIENSRIALLCAKFTEISKEEPNLVTIFELMGDDVDQFISLIGIKENVIQEILPEMEESKQQIMAKYIHERVSILLNNTKPSFFFLAHISLKAIETTNSLSIHLNSKVIISLSCKREANCLQKYLKCLVAMIDVFTTIVPKDSSILYWLEELQLLFRKRKESFKKWVKQANKKQFIDISFDVMNNFENEVKFLVRTICYAYFVYSLIIDELSDIITNISLEYKLNKKYVKDVTFVLSCFEDNFNYHNRSFVKYSNIIHNYITTLPYNKSQCPEMLATIEELKRLLIYRSKIEKRTNSINLSLYKINQPTLEDQMNQCDDLQLLLQNLNVCDSGLMTFRSQFTTLLVDSQTKEKLFELKAKVSKGCDISQELLPIRNIIFQEYIFLIHNLLVEHCMLLRQVSENFDLKRHLYLEYYLNVISTQANILFELHNIINPSTNDNYEKCFKVINQLKEKYSFEKLKENEITFKDFPLELSQLMNLFISQDQRSISIIKGIQQSLFQNPILSFFMFENRIISNILNKQKLDDIEIEIFTDSLQNFCTELEDDFIIKLEYIPKEFSQDTLVDLKLLTTNILRKSLSNENLNLINLSEAIFISISHFYSKIIITSNEEYQFEQNKINRIIQLFFSMSKQFMYLQYKQTLSIPVIEAINSSMNQIIDKIYFKEEDRWTFSYNFGKRILFLQLLDILNFFGIKGTLMYIHCFMRRDVICKGQIPWIVFVSIKEFLGYLQEVTLIEVEDFKIDTILKLLKERINKILPSVFDWSLLYSDANNLLKILDKEDIQLPLFIQLSYKLIQTCVFYAFVTENSKQFRKIFDIIETLHKTIHAFDSINENTKEFIDLLHEKKPILIKTLNLLMTFEQSMFIYHTFKTNKIEFEHIIDHYANDYPSKIVKPLIEHNTDGNYDTNIMIAFVRPYQRFMQIHNRFDQVINLLYLFQQAKNTKEYSPIDAVRYYSAFVEMKETIEILLNCIETFELSCYSNELLKYHCHKLRQFAKTIVLETDPIEVTYHELSNVRRKIQRCYKLYTFTVVIQGLTALQSAFERKNREQCLHAMFVAIPMILALKISIKDEIFVDYIPPLKLIDDMYVIIENEQLFESQYQKLCDIYKQLHFEICLCIEKSQMLDKNILIFIETLFERKYQTEAYKQLLVAFEISKQVVKTIQEHVELVNPFYGSQLFFESFEKQLKLLDQNQLQQHQIDKIIKEMFIVTLQKANADAAHNYSYPNYLRQILLILQEMKETNNITQLCRLLGGINSYVFQLKTDTYYRENYNANILEWTNNFLVTGCYKSFCSILFQSINHIEDISNENNIFNKYSVEHQCKYVVRNALCVGFQQLQIASELSHKSLKYHANKSMQTSIENQIITLLSVDELQKIHSFFELFRTDDDGVLENEGQINCSVSYDQRMLRHLKKCLLQLGQPKDNFFIRTYLYIRATLDVFKELSIQTIYSKIVSMYTLAEIFIDTIYAENMWKLIFDMFYIENGKIITSINQRNKQNILEQLPILLHEFDSIIITYYKDHSRDFFVNETLNLVSLLYNHIIDEEKSEFEVKMLKSLVQITLQMFSEIRDDKKVKEIVEIFKQNTDITTETIITIIEQMNNVVLSISENGDSILLLVKSLTKYCEITNSDFNNIISKNTSKRQQLGLAFSTENCLLKALIKQSKHPLLQIYGNFLSDDMFTLWKMVDICHASYFEKYSDNPYRIYGEIAEIMNKSIERLTPLFEGKQVMFALSYEPIDKIELKFHQSVDKNIISSLNQMNELFRKGDTEETFKCIGDCINLVSKILDFGYGKKLIQANYKDWMKWFYSYRIKNYLMDLMFSLLVFATQKMNINDFNNSITLTLKNIVELTNKIYS